jgi:hypothetical protein
MLIKHGDIKPITVLKSEAEIEQAKELAKRAQEVQAEDAKKKETN